MSFTYQAKKTLWDYIARYYHREYDRSGYHLGVDRETYKKGRIAQTYKQLRAYRVKETQRIIEKTNHSPLTNPTLDVVSRIDEDKHIQGIHGCYEHEEEMSLFDLIKEREK